jgi:rhodanese-related sulfurtransferase
MKIRTLVLIGLVLALALTACGEKKKDKKIDPSPTPATYTTMSVTEAHDRLSQNPSAVIVDVRQPEEWATTGVPVGAKLIPLPDFEQRAPAELPKDQDIYVICNSGNRSRTASDILIKLGYTKVFNVEGGIQAWLQASLPTEAYTTP